MTHALVKRLLRDYVRPHKGKIALAVICMVIVAAMTAMNAWLMQPILDEIFLKKDREMLMLVPAVVIIIALVKGVSQYGQDMIMRWVGQRVISDMQLHLFSHLIYADLAMFHDQASGKLISRFTNDIQMMRLTLTKVLTGLAKESLTLVFLIGVMFYQSWQLAVLAFLVFPLAVHPVIRLGKRMRKISDQTQNELGVFTSQLDEIFQGARIVKAYSREKYEIGRAQSIIEGLFRLYVKASRVHSAASPIMEALAGIAIAAVVWYGGLQVIEGGTTPGAFFSFITAMIMAYRPVKSIAGLNNNLQEGLAAAKRYFSVIDAEPKIREAKDARPLGIEHGAIAFDGVKFSYDGKEEALKGVTMEVPAGKTVALVGPSGGGKSTMLNLILRYYQPQEGVITIDGQDISRVTFKSLRDSISLVSQETILFDDTVRANIAYGKISATEEEIVEAAKAAAAHDFISALPEGYDTMIGQHGVRLSGGQRQRISIARAVLKNAPILLLDEATSALDPVSEKRIQEALHQLMEGRTTLVIAHRLSTVVDADLIYVVMDGTIAEAGSHKELLGMGGVYSHLYDRYLETGTAATSPVKAEG